MTPNRNCLIGSPFSVILYCSLIGWKMSVGVPPSGALGLLSPSLHAAPAKGGTPTLHAFSLVLADGDIVRHLVDALFALGELLQGIDQVGTIGLLDVAFEHARVPFR